MIKEYIEQFKVSRLVKNTPVQVVDPTKDVGDRKVLGSIGASSFKLPAQIKKGTRGPGQVALKRAMAVADPGSYRWRKRWGKKFGAGAVKELKRLQKRWGLKVDGEYGPATHARMAKYYDAYGRHLMRSWHPVKKTSKLYYRNQVVKVAMFAHSHAPRHYSQNMYLRCEGLFKHIHPPQMWNYEDCSGFALWCMYVVFGYDAARARMGPLDGWTGSMQQYGYRVSLSSLLPGDMIFYNNHVGLYVGHGMVVTHGHESGPFFVSMYYRTDIVEARRYI